MKTYEQISGIIHTDTQYTSNATAAAAAAVYDCTTKMQHELFHAFKFSAV